MEELIEKLKVELYAAAERAAFPDLPYHEAILLSVCNHP